MEHGIMMYFTLVYNPLLMKRRRLKLSSVETGTDRTGYELLKLSVQATGRTGVNSGIVVSVPKRCPAIPSKLQEDKWSATGLNFVELCLCK